MRLIAVFLAPWLRLRACAARKGAPANGLQALAVQWQAIGLLLAAMARRVSLAKKMRAQGEAAFARELEAALYTALIKLSADITAHAAPSKPRTQADENALAYLKHLHALLGVIALLVRQMRLDLEVSAERLARLARPAMPAAILRPLAPPARAETKAPP